LLTFSYIDSPAQCQSCQQKLTFQYFYPSETIQAINWFKESDNFLVGYAHDADNKLIFVAGESGYANRITWDETDPASFTLSDLTATDTDSYLCYVIFKSGNYIKNSTFLDTSSPLCK
jgi:hypothetical protein